MKIVFKIGTRKVLVDSLVVTQLHGDVIEISRECARKEINQMTHEALDRFVTKLRTLWGQRKFTMLTPIPMSGPDSTDAEINTILRLYVGGAWLDSSQLPDVDYAPGSHALVIWTQPVTAPVSFPKILGGRSWESIAENYEI